jgi:ATP-dependent exoDNAse (exonuclease V) beta subunit
VLDQYDTGGDCADAFNLHSEITNQLKVEDQKASVNLLTIHKAKGLEFDTVILPALDAGTRGDDKPVLAWQEIVRPAGDAGLIIAPMERTGDDKDKIFEFARNLNKAQDSYEKDRLLYVAATRARLRMHLFFGLKTDDDNNTKSPAKGSLLGRLWPAISDRHEALEGEPGTEAKLDAWLQPVIRRYSNGWSVPEAPAEYQVPEPVAVDERMHAVSYDWASPLAKHVGNVVHRWLEKITREDSEDYDAARLEELRPLFSRMLLAEDVQPSELEKGVDRVTEALLNTLTDETGRWLLADTHAESACEYPITMMRDNRMRSMIIDRTFVDQDGVRWIVDYKTGSHGGGSIDTFFEEEEQRYADQLQAYRDAMQLLEPERTIKTALYYPLLKELRELDAK